MFRRIVVLPRGNDAAQPALQRAMLCAAPTSDLAVLDVVYEPMLGGYLGNKAVYESLRKKVVDERQSRASALAATLNHRDGEAFGKAIWHRQRDEAVAEYVRSRQADLVVTEPLDGGRGGLSSSDWRLIATCPAPVLIVKGPADRQYRQIVAAVDPFHAHAKPAQLDARILTTANTLQAQTHAGLAVLHCFTPPEYFRTDSRLALRDEQFEQSRRDALEKLLHDAGISSVAHVVAGAPHKELEAMAKRGEADVIVMGALARGRVKDWIIGSTTERVLHRTLTDVLVVNPH